MEVNNKRRITLTLIGVATLLILVLSATFAYFSAQTSNDKGTTNVTASTEKVGSIALSNPTGDLHLNLSVSDMAQDNLNTYWATDNESKNYDSEEKQRDIAVAELSGGSATAKYECTTTISVELSDTMASKLQPGDGYIQFGELLTDKIDLTSISADGYNVTFLLDGTNTKKQRVTAAIALENRNADQSYLAGSKLGITFSNSDLECQVVGSSKYKGSKLSEAIMAMSEEDGSGVYHETGTTTVPGTYSAIPASESEWTSVTATTDNTIVGSGNRWGFSCSEQTEDEDFGTVCATTQATATFIPKEAGYYKIELINPGNTSSAILVDGSLIKSAGYGEEEGTDDLGYLTPENVITIREVFSYDSATEFEVGFIFYRKSADVEMVYDAGYRYEGETVNNYVTFNNETWRIIGVEEGSTIGLTSGKYYTKIIRSESIGNHIYKAEDGMTGEDLEYALNNAYYNSEYWDTELGAEYDYTNSGIKEETRPLIVEANWYRIALDNVYTPAQTYIYEKIGTSESRYVGLMSPSDYGYAALQSECANVNLQNFESCKSWLFNQSEWLWGDMTDGASGEWMILSVNTNRSVSAQDGMYGSLPARPAVYLNSDVIITNNGTGEIDNQYEIALSE